MRRETTTQEGLIFEGKYVEEVRNLNLQIKCVIFSGFCSCKEELN